MELAEYLERIRYRATPTTDLETLRGLHRAHLRAIPFEDLDVQLRRPVSLDIAAIYRKIVRGQRGGWCYETNGLMAWALQQVGFDVMRMSGGVMRESMGDGQLGNHLCLLVRIDKPYLVNVGFGGSLVEPIELREGQRNDVPYRVSLREIEGGYYRYTEEAQSAPFSFDFRPQPADEALLAAKCSFLQSDPASPFVQTLVVQRRVGDTHLTLRGRVFMRMRADRVDRSVLNSPDEMVAMLRSTFDLDVPEVATLWPAICARHEALFGKRG